MSTKELSEAKDRLVNELKVEREGRAPAWQRLLQIEIELNKENCIGNPVRAAEYAAVVKNLRALLDKTNPAGPM
jgi:hypothetical protein